MQPDRGRRAAPVRFTRLSLPIVDACQACVSLLLVLVLLLLVLVVFLLVLVVFLVFGLVVAAALVLVVLFVLSVAIVLVFLAALLVVVRVRSAVEFQAVEEILAGRHLVLVRRRLDILDDGKGHPVAERAALDVPDPVVLVALLVGVGVGVGFEGTI